MAGGKSLSRYLISSVNPFSGCRGRFSLCLIVVFAFSLLHFEEGKTQNNSEGEVLVAGTEPSATLAAGETKSYRLDTKAAQHIRLELEKGDLALKVTACPEGEQTCLEFTKRDYGTLDISFTTTTPKKYSIHVTSLEKDSVKRRFQLRVVEIVEAIERHRFVDSATRASAEAENLKEQHDLTSRLAAIAKYDEAQRAWMLAAEHGRAAEALCNEGDVYFSLSQYKNALGKYQKALIIGARDKLVRLRARNGIGYMHTWLGDNARGLKHAQRVLQLVEREGSQSSKTHARIAAQAITTIGEVYYARRNQRRSIEQFERSIPLWKKAEFRDGEALALLNIGYSTGDLGDFRKAADYYERSLQIFQATSNGRGVAYAETVLGGARSKLGETQSALDSHNHALQYFQQIGDKQGQAVAHNGIATAYEDLSEHQSAIDNYLAALRLYEELGNRRLIALNKFVVGRALFRVGERDRAERSFRESLTLSRKIRDRVIEASVVESLAAVYFARGEIRRAQSHVSSALAIYRKLENRQSEAYALNDQGRYLASSGNPGGALYSYQQALPLMVLTGDQRGKALTLLNLGKLERSRGNLTAAQSLVEQSLAITETLHKKIRNSQLRISFFASVQEQYEVYINVLMLLHQKYPEKSYDTLALVANERSRARSLLSSLLEGKIARQNITPGLAAKELELLQALEEKAERQMSILSRGYTPEESQQVKEEIRALTIEYQDVRSQLKRQNSPHAVLTETSQLRSEDLQRIIADDETLLLEFALGEEGSYLWAVSRTGITSYELPSRSTIESLVRKVYELATIRESTHELNQTNVDAIKQADAEYWRQAAQLSTMLLGPVAAKLGSKRLLIVADGSLHYLMFDALPSPGLTPEQITADLEPLFLKHEVISIPSALTLSALGAVKNNATVSSKTLAVFADPVFDKNDPRVVRAQGNVAKEAENAYLSATHRSFVANDTPQKLSRLPSTLREAKAILAATHGEGVVTTGLAATKEQVLNGGVKGYRVVHFATHGLLNSEHPELSGIVLSLLDERGNDRNGFLRVYDVYNLDLSADLIVLSACRTGLGKDIRGEGVIGLPSAFMYAGAKSIVASLWKVDDEATAELMGHFYFAMFNEGLPPAAALRKAKEKMWRQERWRAPFYWAAFVFQGQYSNQIEVPASGKIQGVAILGGIFIVSFGSAYAMVRIIKQRRKSARERRGVAGFQHFDPADED